jgi:hypothetical protein
MKILLAIAALCGCSGDKDPGPGAQCPEGTELNAEGICIPVGGDADTDTDADTDADTDTDSGTGTGTETGTGTVTDSGTGTGGCDPECPEGMTCAADGGCVPEGPCEGARRGRCPDGELCQCVGGACECVGGEADECDGACSESEFCICLDDGCYCSPFECGRTGECPERFPYCECGAIGGCACHGFPGCGDGGCPDGEVCVHEDGRAPRCEPVPWPP